MPSVITSGLHSGIRFCRTVCGRSLLVDCPGLFKEELARELLRRQGGLPRTKAKLIKLAMLVEVEVKKTNTVKNLKRKIKPETDKIINPGKTFQRATLYGPSQPQKSTKAGDSLTGRSSFSFHTSSACIGFQPGSRQTRATL